MDTESAREMIERNYRPKQNGPAPKEEKTCARSGKVTVYTKAYSRKVRVYLNREMTADECRLAASQLKEAADFSESGSYDNTVKTLIVVEGE